MILWNGNIVYRVLVILREKLLLKKIIMKELYKKIDEFYRKVNLRNKREMSGTFFIYLMV